MADLKETIEDLRALKRIADRTTVGSDERSDAFGEALDLLFDEPSPLPALLDAADLWLRVEEIFKVSQARTAKGWPVISLEDAVELVRRAQAEE